MPLTAQLSQAGEDAKRAVRHFSFFSFTENNNNTNTVCTIKSAPPRSPDVLNMLATKSGWLYKRNEQHVWQARWCCVVPHTFLYYFDAHPAGENGEALPILQPPSSTQQDQWNRAVEKGYGSRPPRQEKRANFGSFFPSSTAAAGKDAEEAMTPANAIDDDAVPEGSGAASQLKAQQPAGIIDLECYTAIHRSSEDGRVMEFAGDDDLNPDLRAFYFCAGHDEDVQDWIGALLHNRHTALLDECDAYKQVCDGFSQQLQLLHSSLDDAGVQLEEAQQELYRVRSQQEDVRRQCWRRLDETVLTEARNNASTSVTSFYSTGTTDGTTNNKSSNNKNDNKTLRALRDDLRTALERIRAQDMGVPVLMQTVTEHILAMEDALDQEFQQKVQLQTDWQQSGQSDQAKVDQLTAEMEQMKAKHANEMADLNKKYEQMQSSVQEMSKELDTAQKALASKELEMTMHGSQQRNAVKELQQHKKILKKEVLELRAAHERLQRQVEKEQHVGQQKAMQAEQEKQKCTLLEKYVEKMESQVQVQQNMMEMMSHHGSVYGGGSVYGAEQGYPPRAVVPTDADPVPQASAAEDMPDRVGRDRGAHDDAPRGRGMMVMPPQQNRRMRRTGGYNVDDIDNKSHVSELTEDRTQRYFEASQHFSYDPSPRASSRQQQHPPHPFRTSSTPRQQGPPSIIIGVQNADAEEQLHQESPAHQPSPLLDTIQGSASSLGGQQATTPNHSDMPRTASNSSLVSTDKKKMSVAQRARLEAAQGKTTPVRARLELDKPESDVKKDSESAQQGEKSGLWRRMEEAVLGPRSDEEGDDDSSAGSSLRSTRVTDYSDANYTHATDEEKKSESTPALSLQERSRLQRERQLQVLREKGILSGDTATDASVVSGTSLARSVASLRSPATAQTPKR